MKKLLSILLFVALIISLATTALADDTEVAAETDARYRQAVLDTLPSYEDYSDVKITRPTENFFVMKAPLSDCTVLVIETNSETPIRGWHCYLFNYGNKLVAAPFVAVNYDDSEWVINSISKDFGYIKKVGDNNTNSIKGETWVGFSLLSEIKEDVEIRIKVYELEHSSSQFNPDDPTTYGELKAQTTYTFKAKAEGPSSAFKLETSESEIKCGETLDVEVKANSASANDQLTFTYDAGKFEPIIVPNGWTANTDGSYSYTCAAAITSETSLGTFQFKAKMLADAADAVFTVGKTADTTPVQAKVKIGLNTIQYEVHDVSAEFGGTQKVVKTYNGLEQQVEITVTELADVTFKYSNDNGGVSDGNWYDDSPTLKDAGYMNYHVKISAPGYRDALIRIQFVIEKAQITITPKNVTLKAGDPLPTSFEYEVTGLVGNDTLTTAPTITCSAADTSKPGTYTLTASAADAGGNYTITYATGTLTVKEAEPNIPETHEITVIDPANGTVKVNPSNGSAGTLITVTATPDEGYELAYITVDGEKISGNTFRMPDHDVTVSGVFVPVTFPFVDVKPGDWFYEYVVYVYSNGLMDGTSATTFEPNANMTRAMVWAILARIDGETVTGANWIDTARAWAMAEGVSDGTDPNGLVTREQFATMLWRYAGEPASNYSLGAYTDAASVSSWAETAMRWAVEKGIITGVTDSTLVPQGTATRAQCAAMLMRFVEL